MTEEQRTLVNSILSDLALSNRSIEGTHFAVSTRIMAAEALLKKVEALHKQGEKIARPTVLAKKMFDFLCEIAVKGERGYTTMEHTREAAQLILEAMVQAYDMDIPRASQLYRDTYSRLIDTYYLLEKTENFRMPKKNHA